MTVPPAASDLGWARPETPSGTGVLVVSGSSGRLDLGRAHRFAEVGATALALRWFGGAGPAVPREVPLEIFAAGLDLLAEECDRLVVLGLSYGAEGVLREAASSVTANGNLKFVGGVLETCDATLGGSFTRALGGVLRAWPPAWGRRA